MVLSAKDGVGWKLLVTCWALMECLLFGGLVFGWGSLNFVLKSEGIYADLCPQDPPVNDTQSHTANETSTEARDASVKCKAQDSRMALCFTVASAVFPVGCVVLGHVTYKYGTRIARLIAFIFYTVGSLMMTFLSKDNPWLIFPGWACIGIGGFPLLFTNFQVSNLFVKGRSSVIGILSGALDTSSAIMLLLKIASENGFTRQHMFLLITTAHSLVLVSTFFFLPKDFIMRQQTRSMTVVVGEDMESACQLELKDEAKANTKPPVAAKSSLSNCVRNPMFLTHLMWMSLTQLRFLYFIGTLNPFLERILDGDVAKVSYFTNACYLIMAGGLVASLFSGSVHDWQKRMLKDGKSKRYRTVAPAAVPTGITSLLSVIMSILVLIPNASLLYVTFVVMTVKRAFLYSIAAAFISEVFPQEYFGVIYGTMQVCGGIIGFFQFALFSWAEAYQGGAMHVDIFLVIMVCLTFIHPIFLWISSWKEEKRLDETL